MRVVSNCTRSELLRVNLTLDKAQVDKYKEEIVDLIKHIPGFPFEEGDTLRVAYEFRVDYFNDVLSNFRRLRTILADPKVIRQLSLVEINYGESVIVELLDEIRKVQLCLQ